MSQIAQLGYSSPSRESLTTALKSTVKMPMLEGAAGVVGGIVIGDYAGTYFATLLNQVGTGALAVKGVTKFAVAGASLFLTSASRGPLRIAGLGIALGSVASFFIDLLAASPWATQLGLSSVRSARATTVRQPVQQQPVQFSS